MSPTQSLIRLQIDGRPVEVEAGATVLDAARKLNLDIPTLCYLERCGPMTSCLVCLVKVGGRLVPSCGLPAQEGMVVESETEEIHTARRTALELLFSDHVGDCLSPCNRICPLHLNIPAMIRQIEAGRNEEAILTVRQALPLAGVLGRLCHRPCEHGCRRATHDNPAAIREMERSVVEIDQRTGTPHLPFRRPASGKSVVIVGSGPAGLGAAYHLLREGHSCTIIDRHEEPGGSLRHELDEAALPRAVLEAEIELLRQLGAKFKMRAELGHHVTIDGLRRGFDAILIAVGELARDGAPKFGLPATASGLKGDLDTGETAERDVFVAGSALRPIKQVVKAIAEGRDVAESVNQFLAGRKPRKPARTFSSIMGRLNPGEIDLFMIGPSRAPRTDPLGGLLHGFTSSEAKHEAGRCLHCDCRMAGFCKLQHYATTYQADAGRFKEQRRAFEQQLQHGEIIFEPGKCILCGICVKLTEQAREPLGLTFIGRGFDVRIGAPLNATIADGLKKVARECVEFCPTGALAFADRPPAKPGD